MSPEEQVLARRILEAGRGGSQEELPAAPEKKRDWSGELREAGLEKVWQLECRLAPVVSAMRERGFRVDGKMLEFLARTAEKNRAEAEKKVKEVLGEGLNPR
ncbi:MAG: hypothetical protein EBT68_04975, partial [Verrucomicrobia bacterium]|nr:hypothetical protein [Verrucomicrobiota bacterium]